MRRVLAMGLVFVAVAAVLVLGTGAAQPASHARLYRIEMDNAFGLIPDASFKVDGVVAGTISKVDLDQRTLNALITVKVTTPGIPDFHTNASCDSEPQSLIGEYFLNCNPGTGGGRLGSGATIPVTHTTSTIPSDLVLDILRVPERQRLALIINSLGAGVAARSDDIAAALDRALPALRNTDQLLSVLAADRMTLQSLTHNANTVVTTLAQNSGQLQRFIQYAGAAAADTDTQSPAFRATLARLPGFLAQLGPNLTQLGNASAANTPALVSFNRSASQLTTLLKSLPSFTNAARPGIAALGRASVTGLSAVRAADPTVRQLVRFSRPVPELARNLSIVLPFLDTQQNATEPNPRSPGGKGYSGIQSLLQFAFNLAAATNYFGPEGHMLGVDAFVSGMCSPYATPQTIAQNLARYGASYRSCYAFLGPQQPGVNTVDPSNPSACVPDPGGQQDGHSSTPSSVCKLTPARRPARATNAPKHRELPISLPNLAGRTTPLNLPTVPGSVTGTVNQTLGTVTHALGTVAGTVSGVGGLLGGHTNTHTSTTASTQTTTSLLNYLLGP